MVGLLSSSANKLRQGHAHLLEPGRAGELIPATVPRAYKPPRRFTESETKAIIDGYLAGKTVYELADTHRCNRTTISAVLKRNGVPLRLTPATDEQVEEMIHFYRSGLSLAAVAAKIGVNASTVLNRLREHNVPTRDSHGRPTAT